MCQLHVESKEQLNNLIISLFIRVVSLLYPWIIDSVLWDFCPLVTQQPKETGQWKIWSKHWDVSCKLEEIFETSENFRRGKKQRPTFRWKSKFYHSIWRKCWFSQCKFKIYQNLLWSFLSSELEFFTYF